MKVLQQTYLLSITFVFSNRVYRKVQRLVESVGPFIQPFLIREHKFIFQLSISKMSAAELRLRTIPHTHAYGLIIVKGNLMIFEGRGSQATHGQPTIPSSL